MQVDVSQCVEEWDDTESQMREVLFSRHQMSIPDYLASNGDSVGQNKLIYKINGQYYKEAEAWKLILGVTVCDTEIAVKTQKVEECPKSPGGKRTISPSVEKLVNSLRPSVGSLKSFNLKEGENNLTYQYSVTNTVLDKVEVKMYLYKNTDRLIVSDIDGTITK